MEPVPWTGRAELGQWDNYYESKIPDFPKPHNWEQIKFWNGIRFIEVALQSEGRKIWFPGCGIDLSPFIYAYAGCCVYAKNPIF
jgi:hypothetical protein